MALGDKIRIRSAKKTECWYIGSSGDSRCSSCHHCHFHHLVQQYYPQWFDNLVPGLPGIFTCKKRVSVSKCLGWKIENTLITSCRLEAATICPCPVSDLNLLTLKVVSESHDVGYLCANFGLPRILCSRVIPDVGDRQTSDKSIA